MATSIYDAIKSENQKILRLLQLLEDAAGREPEERARLRDELHVNFQLHNRLEDDTLYPLLVNQSKTRETIIEAREENRAAEALLEELQRLPVDDSRFQRTVQVLHAQFLRHMDRDEQEVFPLAGDIVPQEQALQLGERALRQREEIDRHLASHQG